PDTSTHRPDVDEPRLVIHLAHEERCDPCPALGDESGHDEIGLPQAFDLAPIVGAAAHVVRAAPLRHDAFQALGAARLEEFAALALEVIDVADPRLTATQKLREDVLPLAAGDSPQVVAV